ncbi:MAG: YidC/Oxa1 family membrane protein insertase, partial [Deltaproteobacteria bacterium]|nr:YidC/Oxa1 family membrane protein insertase [Deltaproteobacteria bacterium]
MPHILYAITILPLEYVYKGLYIFSCGLTGSYGLGLLCLSVVSTIFFWPLKKMAQSLQDHELALRAVMAPQLAAIKEHSRGAERQAAVNALYARYGYHPLMALRSSIGILLQVPFLCAAYSMLSSYAPIQGHAFFLIGDLGRQDGLLGGINALP